MTTVQFSFLHLSISKGGSLYDTKNTPSDTAISPKKGILVVSFGTSHPDTRAVTINAIEESIRNAHPDLAVYSAWTSQMIIRKLSRTTGEHILTVTEALENMRRDGITDVCIQPTHILNGIENDRMTADALAFRDQFSSISFGAPLLSSTEDLKEVISILAGEYSFLKEDEALILMGHGSDHFSNTAYAALDYMCKDLGFPHIHVGTVEAYPAPRDVLRHLEGKQCRICYRYTHDEIDIFKAVSMPEKARVLDVSDGWLRVEHELGGGAPWSKKETAVRLIDIDIIDSILAWPNEDDSPHAATCEEAIS